MADDTIAAARPLSPNVEGALWMIASALTYTAMTTLIKYLGESYPAALQTFYRQLAAFLVLLPVILRRGLSIYATNRPVMMTLRAAASTLAIILSFYGVQKLPLADANALSFTRTLWMVPLVVFVLREKAGPLRIGASLLGFVGVLIMVRPGASGQFALGLPTLAMLASALLFAFTVTGMKVMSRDHSAMSLLVWAMTLGVVFSLPGALFVWAWPKPVDLLLLCLMGVLATITQGCFIRGMSIGDVGAMAPIDYIRLVFSAVAGFVLFHEVPTLWTWIGAAVVIASTLAITLREQALARRSAIAAAAEGGPG